MTPFRTKDLSLAAYLNLRGHMHQRMDLQNGRECVWEFDRTESLSVLVSAFLGGNAQVEPKQFLREVGTVRREMYNFLNDQGVSQARVQG